WGGVWVIRFVLLGRCRPPGPIGARACRRYAPRTSFDGPRRQRTRKIACQAASIDVAAREYDRRGARSSDGEWVGDRRAMTVMAGFRSVCLRLSAGQTRTLVRH